MVDASPATIEWLLAGDPVIRYQTRRDLLDEVGSPLAMEQDQMLHAGWAARLLACQGADGLWAGRLYSPKWTSTTYTLMLLRRFAVAPGHSGITQACRILLERGLYRDGGINFFPSYQHSETCVTGMVLSILAHFSINDHRLESLVTHLLGQQMPDGGWNCRTYQGATHGSFHTTISVLEGLWEFEQRHPDHRLETEIRDARARAHEFLLLHRLYRSHRTGAVVDPRMTRLSFPPRWRYDILRALDYFQDCRATPDSRMDDALDILRKKRRSDGTWPVQQHHTGREFFRLESTGQSSRWNTVRALRVLRWRETAGLRSDKHRSGS